MKFFYRIVIFLLCLIFAITFMYFSYKIFSSQVTDINFYTQLAAISTTVAALGGMTLLIVTYFTFLETREQRMALEEPIVTLKIIPDSKYINFLNFVLKNTGGGSAYDLNVTFTPNLNYGDVTLNELTMFKRMPLLEKGEEIIFFYDSFIDYLDSGQPLKINAAATYYTLPKDRRSSKKIKRNFEIDFEERKGQMQLVKKDMNDLIKEIQELKQLMVIDNYFRGEKE